MKTIAYKSGVLALLMLPLLVWANKETGTARKEYSDSFSISQGAELELETGFAEIKIINWDKNEISISGFVEVEAKDEERAQELVDKTKVEMSKTGSDVRLEIELGSNNPTGKRNVSSSTHEIEFTIYAPSWISLDAHVTFGTLIVPRIEGRAEIDTEYSTLEVNELLHADNSINLSFGSGEIKHFGGGDLDVSFSEMDIDELLGDIEINTSYGQTSIHSMSRNVDYIDIDNSFGECNIDVAPGETYEVETESSFGDVDFDGNWEVIRKDSDWTSKETKGMLGGGASTNKRIKANTSFGSIRLRSK